MERGPLTRLRLPTGRVRERNARPTPRFPRVGEVPPSRGPYPLPLLSFPTRLGLPPSPRTSLLSSSPPTFPILRPSPPHPLSPLPPFALPSPPSSPRASPSSPPQRAARESSEARGGAAADGPPPPSRSGGGWRGRSRGGGTAPVRRAGRRATFILLCDVDATATAGDVESRRVRRRPRPAPRPAPLQPRPPSLRPCAWPGPAGVGGLPRVSRARGVGARIGRPVPRAPSADFGAGPGRRGPASASRLARGSTGPWFSLAPHALRGLVLTFTGPARRRTSLWTRAGRTKCHSRAPGELARVGRLRRARGASGASAAQT